nr:S8 family peptidase [Metabacillus mangrovi]
MYHLKGLKVDEAAKLAGKNKVRVAVIDGGGDTKHPELKSKIKVSYNVKNPLQKGLADPHGTHVAGIIAAAKGNGEGGYGINPDAEIVSIDVFNRNPYTNDYVIAQGVLKAIELKAQVINMSLGTDISSPILEEAVKKAVDANITVVASAGNSGTNMQLYPASYDGVISVGSTNSSSKLSGFSTYGPSVDVTAPGDAIYSSFYDMEKGSTYAKMSGTSMASPVVAGTASLLLSKNPKLTPYQVNYILNKTAKDAGKKGYDLSYGNGQVDPVAALKFDVKKIPADPKVKQDRVLASAISLTAEDGKLKTVKGSFKKLNQTDYYKLPVKKGENVQLQLKEAGDYDRILGISFYKGKNSRPAYSELVNDRKENGKEGKLYEAKEDGVLVVSVKNAYGNYSESGASPYELSIEKRSAKLEDGNTKETPAKILKAPFETTAPLYFTDEGNSEGDSDYFEFNSDMLQPGSKVRLNLSGVPGIDSSLHIYANTKEESEEPGESGEETENEVEIADNGGSGEGESIVFMPEPGTDYVFEVSNKLNLENFDSKEQSQSVDFYGSFTSFIPYKLSLESKVLPDDEDQYPEAGSEEEDSYEETNQKIIEQAGSITAGKEKTGYLQFMEDEDWYKFVPSGHAIYELSFRDAADSKLPLMEIFTYDEEFEEFHFVGANTNDGFTASPKYKAGLKKNQAYYIRLTGQEGSLLPYRLTIKMLVDKTADTYEDNDHYEDARPISSTLTGNFSSVGDLDFYYFKPAKPGVYSYRLLPVPEQVRSGIQSEFRGAIDPVVVTIEDSNGNGRMEPSEEGNFMLGDYTGPNEPETGSIDAKSRKGYFIAAFNYDPFAVSMVPYKLSIGSISKVDEDRGSVKKNNIPSKPLSLKNGKGSGYYHTFGDTDTYKFSLSKNGRITFALSSPFGLDGKVTVHDASGRLVRTSDVYSTGDPEAFMADLKKGVYYVTVEESSERVSMYPYELTVK